MKGKGKAKGKAKAKVEAKAKAKVEAKAKAKGEVLPFGNVADYARGWVIWMRYWNSKYPDTDRGMWTDYVACDEWNHSIHSYRRPAMFISEKAAKAWLRSNRKRLEENPARFNRFRDWWPDTFKYTIEECRYVTKVLISGRDIWLKGVKYE